MFVKLMVWLACLNYNAAHNYFNFVLFCHVSLAVKYHRTRNRIEESNEYLPSMKFNECPVK